jgi:hypothetical protein
MSQACAILNNFDFSSEESSRLEEDEKTKCKKGHFTGLCLMTKGGSSQSDPYSDYDVSDDLLSYPIPR